MKPNVFWSTKGKTRKVFGRRWNSGQRTAWRRFELDKNFVVGRSSSHDRRALNKRLRMGTTADLAHALVTTR